MFMLLSIIMKNINNGNRFSNNQLKFENCEKFVLFFCDI